MKKMLLFIISIMVIFISNVHALTEEIPFYYPDGETLKVEFEYETEEELENKIFDYMYDESNWKLIGTYTTDKNGEIALPIKLNGLIALKELSAPENYIIDKETKLYALSSLMDSYLVYNYDTSIRSFEIDINPLNDIGLIKLVNQKNEKITEVKGLTENPKTGIKSYYLLIIIFSLLLVIIIKYKKLGSLFIILLVPLLFIPVYAENEGFTIKKVDQFDVAVEGVTYDIYGVLYMGIPPKEEPNVPGH